MKFYQPVDIMYNSQENFVLWKNMHFWVSYSSYKSVTLSGGVTFDGAWLYITAGDEPCFLDQQTRKACVFPENM